jgi:CRP-like cAMP-binding protein
VKFDLLGLEDPVRREVLAVAAWRRFDRGVVLFHEGEAGGSLYVLMRGQVAIRVTTPDGDTATLNVIGPGAAFGELSLLDPATTRTATVQAIEPVQTRPTVNRVMQDLAQAGIIELGRGRFIVVDSTALARAAR